MLRPYLAMSNDLTHVIPAAHREAAALALTATFGDAALSAITPLTGGRSTALVYRVDAGERSAVLRIITQRNPLTDPVRQFAAMKIAAASGVAPAVLHADTEAGMVISAFIDPQPFDSLFNDTDRVAELGALVRQLHDGPALPPFLDAFNAIEQALIGIAASGTVLSPLLQEFLEQYQVTRKALQPHCVLGPSHNDLNPGNLLYDGKRLWIIDWESAWQNDPMFDVATVLHWFGFIDEREAALLRGYFGGEPTAAQRAKLELMRQVVSCYYAVVFLLIPLQRGEIPPSIEVDPAALPTFAAARAMMHARTIPLATPEDHVRFSLIMVNEALQRAERVGYREALRMMDDG
jgi:Ser/Thr protein kinase RdoA (MazF antagonist)